MINYKQIAIGELRDYRAKMMALESLHQKISAIGERMTAVRSAAGDATPTQGGGNRLQESVINAIAQRDTLRQTQRIVAAQVTQVERGLKSLTERQRRILELFYIDRQDGFVERACAELFVERSRLYEEKDEALRTYTISRYGMTEL